MSPLFVCRLLFACSSFLLLSSLYAELFIFFRNQILIYFEIISNVRKLQGWYKEYWFKNLTSPHWGNHSLCVQES
jgi:hypothetical protein